MKGLGVKWKTDRFQEFMVSSNTTRTLSMLELTSHFTGEKVWLCGLVGVCNGQVALGPHSWNCGRNTCWDSSLVQGSRSRAVNIFSQGLSHSGQHLWNGEPCKLAP